MEGGGGGLLGEFAQMNTTAGQPPQQQQAARAKNAKPKTEMEKLLAGEKTYTGAFGDDESQSMQFIEDQPAGEGLVGMGQAAGAGQLFPAEDSTKEDREKLLRRLEMCARAREESTKIMSIRFAQRDAVKEELVRVRRNYLTDLDSARREREERWGRKLQKSPFAVDLVAETQRIDEENRVRDHIEQRKQKLMHQRNREAHNAIFKRAVAESDELDVLREEKRTLLQNEKLLRAMRDVEKSNARTAQILQERRRNDLEQQQKRIQESLVNAGEDA